MKKRLKLLLKDRLAVFGIFIMLLLLLCLLFAPLLASHSPSDQTRDRYSNPSKEHFFGTDKYGRDTFSRIIYGTRVSLVIGVGSVLLGGLIGTILGIIAGFYGGGTDKIIMAITDFMMSFPSVLTGVIVLIILGQGTYKLMIAIGIAFIPRFIRLTRADTLKIRNSEYILAAEALGASSLQIIVKHILPNISSSLLVMITLWAASGIRLEAGLSFLGLGAQPPTPSWGLMLKEGTTAILFTQWLAFFPGLAIFITILSFNFIGDTVRNIIDPRLITDISK